MKNEITIKMTKTDFKKIINALYNIDSFLIATSVFDEWDYWEELVDDSLLEWLNSDTTSLWHEALSEWHDMTSFLESLLKVKNNDPDDEGIIYYYLEVKRQVELGDNYPQHHQEMEKFIGVKVRNLEQLWIAIVYHKEKILEYYKTQLQEKTA